MEEQNKKNKSYHKNKKDNFEDSSIDNTKEYVIEVDDNKNTNQILKYKTIDDKKRDTVFIDSKVKDTALNIINQNEKNKEKVEYKNIYNSNYVGNNKKHSKYLIICGVFFVVLIMFFSTVFSILNLNNEKNIKGITIMGIDVSGLTIDETKSKINEIINNLMEKDIKINYQEESYTTSIIPEQLDTKFNVDDVASDVYKLGRNGNIFENNYEILKCLLNKQDFELNIKINEDTLKNKMYNVSTELPGCVVQSSYYIDGNTLVITNGKEGVIVDQEKIKELIIENIKNQISKNENNVIDLPVQVEQPNPINIDEIHKEIYREAHDAYYTTDPVAVYPDVYGVDFAVPMDKVKEYLSENKEKYEIPLKVLEPNVKIQDLGEEAFPDLLGTFRTNYDNSAANRSTNIRLAAQAINGTILLPGDVFSYNRIIGDTTPEKGYTLGGAYVNGKVVQSYGGGICQVSSTLYNAAVFADLDITMRYNHSSVVGYVKPGRDATVSYGTKDFQFKNSRKYPIEIKASAKNGVLKIDIVGIYQESECEVDIESKVIETIPYKVTYSYNSNLSKGTEKVTVKGANGLKSIAYKIKKVNGNIISKEVLSQDTYNPMNRVIETGNN